MTGRRRVTHRLNPGFGLAVNLIIGALRDDPHNDRDRIVWVLRLLFSVDVVDDPICAVLPDLEFSEGRQIARRGSAAEGLAELLRCGAELVPNGFKDGLRAAPSIFSRSATASSLYSIAGIVLAACLRGRIKVGIAVAKSGHDIGVGVALLCAADGAHQQD